LSLRDCHIGGTGLLSIAKNLPPTLTIIDLESNQIADEISGLILMIHSGTLEDIDISQNQMTDKSIEALAFSINNSSLDSINLRKNLFSNEGKRAFNGMLHQKDDVNFKDVKSFEELKLMITQYMTEYNTKRYQWDIQKMTPVQYRDHLFALMT